MTGKLLVSLTLSDIVYLPYLNVNTAAVR